MWVCGYEGVRLEVSLARATTPYSFTPNLASSGSYPLVGSRPSYLRVHSSRYYQCGGLLQVTDHLYRCAVRGYSYLVSDTEPAGTLSTKFSTD